LNLPSFIKLLIIPVLILNAQTGWAKTLAEMLGQGEDAGQPELCQDGCF